ncbi:myelin transcription factor 1-like protein [Trichonephila clavipes]|nr:myelin transcription factor 1-like protein [Trichonephila clavipes]
MLMFLCFAHNINIEVNHSLDIPVLKKAVAARLKKLQNAFAMSWKKRDLHKILRVTTKWSSSSSNDGSPVNSGSYVSFPVGSKAAKIFQPVKRQRLSTEESEKNGDVENDEEIRVLEDEILELQEYNAKVESEMIKLRTDISQMEQHIRITERDNQSLVQKNHSLSEYYETLRNNFISLLDHVKLPNFDERPSRENFDAYLKRIQTLCTDSCGEENKAVLSAIKQALQDFNFPINATNGWLRS